MIKCTKGQVRQLRTALRWKIPPEQRQRVQMVLLRESGMTQPLIAAARAARYCRGARGRGSDGLGRRREFKRISCLANFRDRALRKTWKHAVSDLGMIR